MRSHIFFGALQLEIDQKFYYMNNIAVLPREHCIIPWNYGGETIHYSQCAHMEHAVHKE